MLTGLQSDEVGGERLQAGHREAEVSPSRAHHGCSAPWIQQDVVVDRLVVVEVSCEKIDTYLQSLYTSINIKVK